MMKFPEKPNSNLLGHDRSTFYSRTSSKIRINNEGSPKFKNTIISLVISLIERSYMYVSFSHFNNQMLLFNILFIWRLIDFRGHLIECSTMQFAMKSWLIIHSFLEHWIIQFDDWLSLNLIIYGFCDFRVHAWKFE